jgi:hypothetical protein
MLSCMTILLYHKYPESGGHNRKEISPARYQKSIEVVQVRNDLEISSSFRKFIIFWKIKACNERFGQNGEPKGKESRCPPSVGRAMMALSPLRSSFFPHFESNASYYPKTRQYIPLSADLISHRVFLSEHCFLSLSFRSLSIKNLCHVLWRLLPMLLHARR